jgi:flagellar protein FliL
MSAAAAAPEETPPVAAPVRGKKRLLLMIGAGVALVLALGGGAAAWYFLRAEAPAGQAADADADDAAEAPEPDKEQDKAVRAQLKNAPAFVPLEPFTVNLADREAERYAQVGITLELADPKAGDLLKAYMPAIRNNILLTLAGKSAGQLMDHQGKLQLAAELRAAALKPLGWSVPRGGDDDEAPIRAVHFSNFIIQ